MNTRPPPLLFSTPGALAATRPAHAFLLQDLVLLDAALATGTGALRAAVAPADRA